MASTSMRKLGIRIGCKDIVFAKMLTDEASATTYDTANMFTVPGVIEAALTAQTTSENIGADDIALYEVFNSLDGFELSLTVASIGGDAKAFLLGSTEDTKGVLIEKASDDAPYVAMGFKSERSDGTTDYVWLYKGKFGQGDSTYHTKEQGTVNWQTPVLTATFIPRVSDQAIRASVNTGNSSASTIIGTFFDTVYTPT